MELLHGLSDDQTALLGCVAALAVCGSLLSAAAFVGRALRKPSPTAADAPATLRLASPQPMPAEVAHRKAA